MNDAEDAATAPADPIARRFGDLAGTMLAASPLVHAWRISFLANVFTGPIYRELSERFDLGRPEFVILLSLSERPGLFARDVCLATGLPKNSISRAVSLLLTKGLIERRTHAEDRRAKPLVLTDAGERMIEATLPLVVGRQVAMRGALSPEEQRTFDQLLMKLIRKVPEWIDPDRAR